MPTSHRGISSSVPYDFIQDSGWVKWQWNRILSLFEFSHTITIPQHCCILTSHHTMMRMIALTSDLIIMFSVFKLDVSSLAHRLFGYTVRKEVYAFWPQEVTGTSSRESTVVCSNELWQYSAVSSMLHVACCLLTSEANLKAAVTSINGVYWLVRSVADSV